MRTCKCHAQAIEIHFHCLVWNRLLFVAGETLNIYRNNLQYIHTWKMCFCYLKYIVVNLIKDFWAETISVVNWSRLVSLLFRLLLDTTTTLSYVSSWNVRMKWSVMKIENAKPPFIVILSYIHISLLTWYIDIPVNFSAMIVLFCEGTCFSICELVMVIVQIGTKINMQVGITHLIIFFVIYKSCIAFET